MGGSSQATALVGGCTAAVRESLIRACTAEPSAALVNALLVNGADPLNGQYTSSGPGATPLTIILVLDGSTCSNRSNTS